MIQISYVDNVNSPCQEEDILLATSTTNCFQPLAEPLEAVAPSKEGVMHLLVLM